MSETETPRTDAAIRDTWQAGTPQKVEAEFARTLERELAAMTATCNELKTALRKIAALDYQNAATNGCAYEANALAHQALVNAWSREQAEGVTV